MNPETAPASVPPPAPAAGAVLPPLETVTGADLASTLPPVNPRAVAAAGGVAPKPSAPAPAAPAEIVRDTKGTVFNPQVHRIDKATGKPWTHPKTGRFMPRGGRKPGLAGEQMKLPVAPKETGSTIPVEIMPDSAPPLSSPSPGDSGGSMATEPPPAPVSLEELEVGADNILKGVYFAGDKLLASKGEFPADAEEHGHLKGAMVGYFKASGKRPLSPFWAFVLTALVFLASRLQKPRIAKRLGLAEEESPPAPAPDPKAAVKAKDGAPVVPAVDNRDPLSPA